MALYQVTLEDEFSSNAKKVADAAEGMIGAFAKSIMSGEGLSKAMSGLVSSINPEALAMKMAAVEAALLVGGLIALGAATVGAMSNAISAAEENNQLRATFQALTGAGAETLEMIKNFSDSLPQSEDQVIDWGKSLAAAGLQGDKLKNALLTVATANAVMGESGSTAALKLITRFQEAADAGGKITINKGTLKDFAAMGLNVDDLAKSLGVSKEKLMGMKVPADTLLKAVDKIQGKGKNALDNMALTWKSMMDKMKKAWNDLFEGDQLEAEVGSFMAEVGSLLKLLMGGSEGAKAPLQNVLIDLFKIATAAIKGVHSVVASLIVIIANVAVAVAPTVNAFSKFMHSAQGIEILNGALTVLYYALAAIGVIAAIVGIALLICISPFIIAAIGVVIVIALIVAAFAGLIAAASYVSGIFLSLGETVVSAFSSFTSGGSEIASQFIAGIVAGLSSGASAVIATATGIASGAVGAVKAALGIASPSKVMMEMGLHTTAGMVDGLDTGAKDVSTSATEMANGATVSASKGLSEMGNSSDAPKSKGSSTGITIDVGGITISGVGSTGEALSITEQQIALIFEKVALAQGL